MRDDLTPIDTSGFPMLNLENFDNSNIVHRAFDIKEPSIPFNIEDTTSYKILQETKELKEKTKEILDKHNAALVNLERQVEELQKSKDSIKRLNANYSKELKEAKKELKNSKTYNAIMLVIAFISMLAAIIIPFIIK